MKASARRRLLIVDDNVDAATSLSMLTEILGHEVRTAHDGLEALDVAAAFRPELILLDIGMPKLNGYDTCRRIREESWGRNIVIAALTGWGQDGDRCQSRAAGFNHHLVKPVDPLMLRKLLASLSGEPAG
jgi:CheY-like chemotaxis protein